MTNLLYTTLQGHLPQNISINFIITGVTDYFTTSSFQKVFILLSKTNNALINVEHKYISIL